MRAVSDNVEVGSGMEMGDEIAGTHVVATPMASRASAPLLAYFGLFFGMLALGMSAIFVKWANAPGPVSGFYRMAIAATVIAIPFAVRARKEAPLSRRHLLLAMLSGLFFAGDLAAWNTSVLITSATNSTLFGNTSPLWVGLGAMVFFREKLRPAFWGGLVLAMLGAIVILGGDFQTHPALGFGDLLALLSGFFYGSFFLVTERVRDALSSLVSWWISAAVCALALLALSLALGQPLTGYSTATLQNLIALALVTQVGGWLALNYSLGHLRASLVAPTLLGQPVLTAILAIPLLGQPITAVQIVGGVLVLGGISIVHRTNR